MTPGEQACVFGVMLCCGACLGVIYDLLMPLRRVKGLCGAGDLLFGTICAAGIAMAALAMQTDAFRLYVFAGAGLGLAAYGLTLGMALRRVLSGIAAMKQKSAEKCKMRENTAGN